MVNLADFSDTSFLEPCKHCGELLQERERFCPFCGTDRLAQYASGGDAPEVELELERGVFGGSRALAAYTVDYPLVSQQDAPDGAIREEVGSGVGFVRPGTVAWQKEASPDGKVDWADSSLTPNRLVLGIAAALVAFFALALVYDHFYLDKQREADRQQAFQVNVAQVQDALGRGDLSAAERGIEVLDTEHPNDPGVQKLKEAFDRRVQEQDEATRRDPVRDAPADAPPGVPVRAEAVAPPAPAAAPRADAPPVAAAAAAAVPAPQPAPVQPNAEPRPKECNEALAALSLCTK
jgi:hypothetical protein